MIMLLNSTIYSAYLCIWLEGRCANLTVRATGTATSVNIAVCKYYCSCAQMQGFWENVNYVYAGTYNNGSKASGLPMVNSINIL
jgi:hypothetical protein